MRKSFAVGSSIAIWRIEIDLRDADMAENQAVLHANAFLAESSCGFPKPGTLRHAARGFLAVTRIGRAMQDRSIRIAQETLIVMGTAVFGGVEIRN